MSTRLTQKEVIQKFIACHGKVYDYSNVLYTNARTPVEIVCRKHGKFLQAPEKHLAGRGCPVCSKQNQNAAYSLGTIGFIKRAKEIHGTTYDYSKVSYTNKNTKVVILCKIHGSFEQSPHSHIAGKSGCPDCGKLARTKSNRITTKDFIAKAFKVHGTRYDYSKVQYTNNHSRITITCSKHGDFEQAPASHLKGSNCPSCGTESKKVALTYTLEEFMFVANSVHADKYSYAKTQYENNHAPITITCKDHGDFVQLPYNHVTGNGCPKCSCIGASKLERKVTSFIKKLGCKVITRNRKILDGKEIDIYLPEHNLGIEVNGLYWHSEKFVEPKTHQEKTLLAEEKGLHLIHLWEDDINSKAPIVKSILRIKLGMAKQRVYARDTVVKEISGKDAKAFLDKTHLMGSTHAKVCLGLMLGTELVSVMTFDKPRFAAEYEWEILRFASILNTIVVGGASKLFAYFVKTFSPSGIVSYADLDHGNGGVYTHLGFKKVGLTVPGYFWVRGPKVLSRYQTQKHKLPALLGDTFDANLSERLNMSKAGFSRSFNSGNAVYAWNRQ